MIKTAVLEYIRTHKATSYVELERLFDQLGFEWQGNYENCSGEYGNIIFWYGWNKEAYEILSSLEREKLISKEPTQPFIYFIDGKTLTLPTATELKKYKKPHWLPVVFMANEQEEIRI